MAVYDVENLMNDIKSFLQAKLNNKLAAIDAEKADGITLLTIESDAYFWQWNGDRLANYNPFVYYGIANEQDNGIGPGTIRVLDIQIIVVVSDHMNDPDIMKRMYRYQRALAEIFEKDWSTVGRGVSFEITGLLPVDLSLFQKQKSHRGIGVSLRAALG